MVSHGFRKGSSALAEMAKLVGQNAMDLMVVKK